MPTSSLGSIARLLNRNSVKAMATALSVPQPVAFPVSARKLIDKASFSLLGGWNLVTTEAIAINQQPNVWHAGHVEDVFPLDAARVLIASASGGVWLAPTDGSFPALPLSNFWRDVDIHCLGAGSRNARHIYAGGNNALFETGSNSLRALARFEHSNSVKTIAANLGQRPTVSLLNLMQLASDAPVFDWRPIPIVDTAGEALSLEIRKLVVVPDLQPPKLVLATEQGLFWSDVPAFGQNYRFSAALGMPSGRCLAVALSSRARGQNQFVVCSPTLNSATLQSKGMYFGTWRNGSLAMDRATHLGNVDFRQWNHAVVASSAANRSILYAAVSLSDKATLRETFGQESLTIPPLKVSKLAQILGIQLPASLAAILKQINSNAFDGLYAVLSSADGGATWSPVGPHQKVEESAVIRPLLNVSQNGYNMSIAVSHADPDIIALGWRNGPSIGKKTPQAFQWEVHGDNPNAPGFDPAIHADCHGLHFDPHDSSGNTLLASCDGGVIFTRDLCHTFVSIINRHLTNLQFQGYPAHPGAFEGASGVSPHTPGLMFGALQDNGPVFSFFANGAQKPWQRIEDGDATVSLVLEKNQMLFLTTDDKPIAQIAKWNGSGLDAAANVPVRSPSPSVPVGTFFSKAFLEPVLRPAFQRAGSNQSMYAVAAYDGSGTLGEIWGLFADPDGGNAAWDFLKTINPTVDGSVKAVASDDGRTLLIGTASGRIFSYDSPSGDLKTMNIDPGIEKPAGQVFQFSFLNNGVAIARFQNALLRFEPQRNLWTAIEGNGLPTDEGSLQFMAVDPARTPNILYTATDFGVHASWDAGANWLPVSRGLPVRSHPSTLRFVADTDGGRQLYLFTFGRSVWNARLN